MRWDALFADLAAQSAALDDAELAAEVAERTRAEVAGLGLVDRLRAAVGADLQVSLRGGCTLRGELARVGRDWLLLDEPNRRDALIATGQLVGVRGLGRTASVPGSIGIVESRIGIRQPLRALARDRSPVRIHLVDGSLRDAVIDRVGSDFLDLAAGELLPIAAVAVVRRSV